jgi:hypothetical protein
MVRQWRYSIAELEGLLIGTQANDAGRQVKEIHLRTAEVCGL